MKTVQPGDQVVSMAPDGANVEVYSVVKVLPDGVQVGESSGKLSITAIRLYDERTVQQILEKSRKITTLKQEIRSLYEGMDRIA
ncbi:MAG: hypothetical protein FJ118_00410 [Deltaproteobacteria bacterium]|nr:hypothetical protein [Deltaproteobacteria bacterium]